jgi:putative phage-type endonuclease
MHPVIADILTRPAIVTHSPEWYAVRKCNRTVYLTASEIPSLRGTSPYPNSFNDLWRSKVEPGFEKFFTPYTQQCMAEGHVFQPEALEKFKQMTGLEYIPEEEIGFKTHPDLPWAGASVDGLCKDIPFGIEVKMHMQESTFNVFTPEGYATPYHYDQVQWQCEVLKGLQGGFIMQYVPAKYREPQYRGRKPSEPLARVTKVLKSEEWVEETMPLADAFRTAAKKSLSIREQLQQAVLATSTCA